MAVGIGGYTRFACQVSGDFVKLQGFWGSFQNTFHASGHSLHLLTEIRVSCKDKSGVSQPEQAQAPECPCLVPNGHAARLGQCQPFLLRQLGLRRKNNLIQILEEHPVNQNTARCQRSLTRALPSHTVALSILLLHSPDRDINTKRKQAITVTKALTARGKRRVSSSPGQAGVSW